MPAKRPFEFMPVRRQFTTRERIVTYVILPLVLLLACCLSAQLYIVDAAILTYGALPLFIIIFLGYFWFRLRHNEPAIQKRAVLICTPLWFGCGLGIALGNSVWLILGGLVTGMLWAWFAFWRFPRPYHRAWQMLRAGEKAQAFSLLNEAIQQRTDIWEMYQTRSAVALMLGYVPHAERDAHKAIAINPRAALSHNALGQAYLAQGRYSEAKEVFAKAVRLAPQLAVQHYNYGFACYRLGEFAAATQAFTLAAKGRLPDTFQLLRLYYLARSQEALGQSDKAQKSYTNMKAFRRSSEALQRDMDFQLFPAIAESMKADWDDIEYRLQGS